MINVTNNPQHEFHQRCSECGTVATTIQLYHDADRWHLVYKGIVAGNGSGNGITAERAAAIIAGYTEPYGIEKIKAAGFYDSAGCCLECGTFYCPTHWKVSTTGGGRCPRGHFKSLDPHWSPE